METPNKFTCKKIVRMTFLATIKNDGLQATDSNESWHIDDNISFSFCMLRREMKINDVRLKIF